MNRREILASIASATIGVNDITDIGVVNRPLAIKVRMGGGLVLRPEQRQIIQSHVERHVAGSELEGLPIFVLDDLCDIEIIEDPRAEHK